jgi:hypothetical protein
MLMIDRLHDLLPFLEQLPPEAQEEAATYIEALAETFEHEAFALDRSRSLSSEGTSAEQWIDPAGTWRDLPDSLLDDLNTLRHASPPSPPLEFL